jgi:UDP-N-acetylglucosamine acyltransferase
MNIHPTAIVDSSARLGPDVVIGPYAVVGADVEIGARTRIGPHVVVLDHVRVGEDCDIHAHAVLGDVPQDLKFRGVISYVIIGPGCVIREGVTIHRGTDEGSATVVGARCYLMANSHVAHNCRLGDRVIMANGALLAGDVQVGDGAIISGNAVVHQFTRIGSLAMLSGGAAVGQDVLPFCTVAAAERNRVGGVNIIGMRRAGFTAEQRRQVRRAFEIVFRSGLSLREAVERLRAEFPDGPAATWAPFIEGARRGICRWRPRRGRRATRDAEEFENELASDMEGGYQGLPR